MDIHLIYSEPLRKMYLLSIMYLLSLKILTKKLIYMREKLLIVNISG